jgi:multidrug resistance efflux pump
MASNAMKLAATMVAAVLATTGGTAQVAQAQTAPTTNPSAGPVTVIASVEAFWSADQYAKTSGYVSDVKVDIGDRVKKGQVLAVIDVPEIGRDLAAAEATLAARREAAGASEAVVRQAEAALEVARKQLAGVRAEAELADVTLKRQQQLFENKAVTEQQLDEVRAKEAVARAGVDVAAAKIAAAEADMATAKANSAVAKAQVEVAGAEVGRVQTLLSYTQIVAPFDGVVTRRMANPGDLVQAATASRTTPLFTCQQVETVRVLCDVPESAAAGVRAGESAEVAVPGVPGMRVRGTVTRLAGSLDPSTRTMRVEIDLPNPDGRLRPGTYAQVTLRPAGQAADGPANH